MALSTRNNLDLTPQITINCHTVIIERPPAAADHPNAIYRSPPAPAKGVWVRSGGILAFVKTLYWNILDRDAESQAVVDGWTKHTYTNGLAQTLGGFFTSPEYTGRGLPTEVTVDKFYLAVLGRHAEAAGRAYWTEKISNGMSLLQVAEGFVGSAEYRGKVQAGTAPDPVRWPTN
ncbi:hypothetical protein BDZ97DRAFT_1843299 [Flammula alnicola]|nr:hypothetical protein BDZ97DRAFT_1843299 [Flammula alnicola]